jgi:hypothetical protein
VPLIVAPVSVITPVSATGAPGAMALTTGIASGDTICVFTGTSVADSTQTVNSVSDTAGNTYTKIGNGGTTFGQTTWVCLASKRALVAGTDTITTTWNITTNVCDIIAGALKGILSLASAVDGYGLTDSASPGTSISRATGVRAQADEIVFAQAVYANAGGAPAWGGGMTLLDTAHTASAYLTVSYAIRTTTASISPACTIASSNWSESTVALKDSLAVPPQQQLRRAARLPRAPHRALAAYR